MSDVVIPTPEAVLRMVADASPSPWFPSEFVERSGLSRDPIDELLNALRLGGFVEIADWIKGRGQGYRLTEAGEQVLQSPAMLARLNSGRRVNVVERLQVREVPPPRSGNGAATTYERGEAVRAALLLPIAPKVARWLFVANVIVFAVSMGLALFRQLPLNQFLYRSDTRILVETGAVSGIFLMEGEWWRLLTCCFVHIGFLHLAVNMYSLLAIGPMAERLWGRTRFAVLYLLAGIGGSWAAMMYHPDSLLAGASGAIWGIMTSIIAWVTLNREHLPPPLIRLWLSRLLTVLVLNIFISAMPGISAAGHFGGGAVGFLVAILLNLQRFGNARQRAFAVATLAATPGLAVLTLMIAMERGPNWGPILERVEQREQLQLLERFDREVVGDVRAIYERLQKEMDERIDRLLNLPPNERKPDEVAAARKALAELRPTIAAADEKTRQIIGPINDRFPVGKEYAIALAGYLKLTSEMVDEFDHRLAEGKGAGDARLRTLRRAFEGSYELVKAFSE